MGSFAFVGSHANIYPEGKNCGRLGGKIYTALVQSGNIVLYASADLAGWRAVKTVTPSGSIDTTGGLSLCCCSSLIHFVYVLSASPYNLIYRTYDPDTDTLSAEVVLNSIRYTRGIGVAADSADNIWVAWNQYYTPKGVFARQKTGSGWQATETLEAGTWWDKESSLIIDADDNPRFFIGLYMYSRSGGVWTRKQVINVGRHYDAGLGLANELYHFYIYGTTDPMWRILPYPYTGDIWDFVDPEIDSGSWAVGQDASADLFVLGFLAPNLEPGLVGNSFAIKEYDGADWGDVVIIKGTASTSDQGVWVRAYRVEGLGGVLFLIRWSTNVVYSYYTGETPSYGPWVSFLTRGT
jgi:hypothetical protein